ncbi:hypothetical protein D9V41_02405 [Aeromicrobium phragmitis]|uniref:Uncharacterized protein n=1 Tax=Aeromicrobium phragmitis TaxID=2478914 RepID=A0A3L8PRI1_9ACTN|nr:hypothetical protein [Aeromicrobium phragmitis]RLV57499.1 hypothetical protein D9V41_02405 [Aeromicrobium phragmitis]
MTDDVRIDWTPPIGKRDAIYGAGATRAERGLAVAAGGAGTALVLAWAWWGEQVPWVWWQWLLAAVIGFDVLGGVVANALNSAKRSHFGPAAPGASFGERLVRRPVLFAAVHVQPWIVALAFAPALWWWGAVWHLGVLAAVMIVVGAPLYLRRPVAAALVLLAVLGSMMLGAPEGWSWLPAAMALKLVLAHAVREEPYRPAVGG